MSLKNFHNKLKEYQSRSGLNIATTYPALIYFNGWGNVEKDQELAHELFSINNENFVGVNFSLIVFGPYESDISSKVFLANLLSKKHY